MGERLSNAFAAALTLAGAAFFGVLLMQGSPLDGNDTLFAFLYSGLVWNTVFFVIYSVYGNLKAWTMEVLENRLPTSPTDDDDPPKAGNTPETPVSQWETPVSHQNQWKRDGGEGEADYVARLRSYRGNETDEQYMEMLLREGVARRYIYQVIPGRNETVRERVEFVSRNMRFTS